jgi:hypothetical protein
MPPDNSGRERCWQIGDSISAAASGEFSGLAS